MKHNEMQPFWDAVSAMIEKRHEDIWSGKGYIEIVSDGVVYRSMYEPDDGRFIMWIRWEPFGCGPHYSHFNDPGATVRWVEQVVI